jgi:hypothetical protein
LALDPLGAESASNCGQGTVYHATRLSSRTFHFALESHGKKVNKYGKMWKNLQGVTGVRERGRVSLAGSG